MTGRRFTARIGNLFLVLHLCNIWIYFLLLLTQVDFFGTTFYFLESRKFSHYFYFLKSRIFGMYFYFLESSKVIYFWQHWTLLHKTFWSVFLGTHCTLGCIASVAVPACEKTCFSRRVAGTGRCVQCPSTNCVTVTSLSKKHFLHLAASTDCCSKICLDSQ